MSNFPFLSVLTFVPILGGLLLLGLEPTHRRLARNIGLGFACTVLILAGCLWSQFDPRAAGLQFVERYPWVPTVGVEYFLGIDGLGLLMVLLTALVIPLALAVTEPGCERLHLYLALVLFLEAGLIGTFTALNFIHWFVFWEVSLIPAFFLIKFWGGPFRNTAALQFFLFTLVGSIALLLSFLAIYLALGTFDLMRLAEYGRSGELASALSVRLKWYQLSSSQLTTVIFLGAFLGFAVKVPLIPFHGWLPSTYAEAPTSTTMLLTALMSKMGVYGFLRLLLPIFPAQMRELLVPLLWLTVLTIVCSAGAALVQRDLKRLLAYSSMNHLGYCALGICAAVQVTGAGPAGDEARVAALHGVFLQMFNHGIIATSLFCLVGFLEQRSGGLRSLTDFGGLRQVAPVFCGFTGIFLFASLGLPGLSGFVGEFLIFRGAFAQVPWATILSLGGLLLTALFLLGVLHSVFNGPLNVRWQGVSDLNRAERWVLIPALCLTLALGIYPQLAVGMFNQTVRQLAAHLTF